MRLRDIKGKRIVGLRQSRMRSSGDKMHWVVEAIYLEDGTHLLPNTVEPDLHNYSQYGTEFAVWKPGKDE